MSVSREMPSTITLSPQEIQNLARDNQRMRLMVEKLICVVGDFHPVAKEAREVIGR